MMQLLIKIYFSIYLTQSKKKNKNVKSISGRDWVVWGWNHEYNSLIQYCYKLNDIDCFQVSDFTHCAKLLMLSLH